MISVVRGMPSWKGERVTKEQSDRIVEICANGVVWLETLRELRRLLNASVSAEHCLLVIDQAFEKTGARPSGKETR
jgi:hypothetical protein